MSASAANPVSRPWRRFLRFSVRGLIVVVLIVGGWLGWVIRSARIQSEAVAAIERTGGLVLYDWGRKIQNSPIPVGPSWAPHWLVEALGVDCFGHVDAVFCVGGSDETMAHVERFTQLREFHFLPSSHQLPDLSNLSPLDLNKAQITERELTILTGLTRFSVLDFDGPRISSAGLARLKGLVRLSYIDLEGSRIKDDALVHLTALSNLTELSLNNTQVTDAGLAQLVGLKNLSALKLRNTPVTDAGLVHLSGLTKLSKLDLVGTHVTDAAVKELGRALPSLKIYR